MPAYWLTVTHVDDGRKVSLYVLSRNQLRQMLSFVEEHAADRGLNVSCDFEEMHEATVTGMMAWLGSLGGIVPDTGDVCDLSGPLTIHPPVMPVPDGTLAGGAIVHVGGPRPRWFVTADDPPAVGE